jgi:outer membrane lipoprotein-sorting protein
MRIDSVRFVVVVALAALMGLAGLASAFAQVRIGLDQVIENMTRAGNAFTTMEAHVDRDTVNALVDDHDLNGGTVYFAADGESSRIRLTISEPARSRQDVLVAAGQFQSYNPRTNQVTQGSLGGRSDIAQFLVVGFGPGNASLASNFGIELIGEDDLDGTRTSVLQLIPRSEEVLRSVSRIRLWVDQERWIPIQQRLDQPSLNYQVVKYSEVDLNSGIADSVFDLDLPGNVEILRVN